MECSFPCRFVRLHVDCNFYQTSFELPTMTKTILHLYHNNRFDVIKKCVCTNYFTSLGIKSEKVNGRIVDAHICFRLISNEFCYWIIVSGYSSQMINFYSFDCITSMVNRFNFPLTMFHQFNFIPPLINCTK